MRVCLFTDTLNDVNGVSRFIRNVGDQALAAWNDGGGHELHIITSTRLPIPPGGERPNIHIVRPRVAMTMPGYPQLEAAWAPSRVVRDLVAQLRPDVFHISTPGPVGVLGRRIAKKLRLPMVGTYHTDFPAYIEHLFELAACTWLCTQTMAWFYKPFARLFTRSAEYEEAIVRLGIPRGRIARLRAGIDTAAFDANLRDETGAVWDAYPGVRKASVKVLYVGRVSVEKNLPALVSVWKLLRARRGADAQLLVVGDGPYKCRMEDELRVERGSTGGQAASGTGKGLDVVFLGFRYGEELSRIYASADVFVFPSCTDTLGQVVMESQCAGLPVIVTDQGGPPSVVDDGVTGFVLPAPQVNATAANAWAATLARLIEDGALRKRMGAAGRRKMEPMTIRSSFEHFWKVHEEAAAEGANRPLREN